MRIEAVKQINEIQLETAPDKSITHRAVMFNSAASGKSVIKNALMGEDCLSTIECMRILGAEIEIDGDTISIIKPIDRDAIRGKSFKLYAGNSGTTVRLICGLLSGLGLYAEIDGDASIRKRPMERVASPLRLMDADIKTTNGSAPLYVSPSELKGVSITMENPSAQVKSAVILAALSASGITEITEPAVTRDHTELMLKSMGADIDVSITEAGKLITVYPSVLKAVDITVGGDISSAAYWLVLGAVIPGALIQLMNVNINPTRTGILTVMKQAGCNVKIENIREAGGEPTADITVEYTADLKPFEISGAVVPLLIDEIPVLAVLACFIKGQSIIKNAAELKIKESDRIDAVTESLKAFGADITPAADGMTINGTGSLKGADKLIKTRGDHRIAMAMAIAALASGSGAEIDDMECCTVSFPGFINELEKIQKADEVYERNNAEAVAAGSASNKYALIGAGISYSASPLIHNALFKANKIDAEYNLIDAEISFIKDIKKNMAGYSGFNVTKPYKTLIIPYLDKLDISAAVCGAVNTVAVKDGVFTGYNTDGEGFLRAAEYHNIDFKDKRILILGAGGAARAVIAALSKTGYTHISIYNKTVENAEKLKKELKTGDLEVLKRLPFGFKTDIIINCTTAGLDGKSNPLPDEFRLANVECIIDLIYNPAVTPLLMMPRPERLKTVNGAAMLVFQAAKAQEIWTGNAGLTINSANAIIEAVNSEIKK